MVLLIFHFLQKEAIYKRNKNIKRYIFCLAESKITKNTELEEKTKTESLLPNGNMKSSKR